MTPRVIQQIRNLSEFAPLHNPGQAAGIEAFEKILPDVPQVAVFDTSFHQTMDPVNYLYSIPYEYYEKYGVRKFGAHGTSHRYVSQAAADYLHKPLNDLNHFVIWEVELNDAIEDGNPLILLWDSRLPVTMSTRSGDIDPTGV